jgi:hypothetical protein
MTVLADAEQLQVDAPSFLDQELVARDFRAEVGMAEIAIPRNLFADILRVIGGTTAATSSVT